MYAIHGRNWDGHTFELTEPRFETSEQALVETDEMQAAYGPSWKLYVVRLVDEDPDGTRYFRPVLEPALAAA